MQLFDKMSVIIITNDLDEVTIWQDPINDEESRHRSMQNNDYEEEKTTEKAEYMISRGFEANESYRYNSYVFMCNCTKVESSLLQIDPAHRYVELFPDIFKKNQNKKFNN